LKPNKNQTAATFWRQVVYQLIYDGECLIVPTRDNYLVVAEDYERIEFAVREDKFRRVRVKNLDLSGEFKRSEVIFLQYGNEELSSLVDSLFGDYGELIARMFELQKMKGQLRATVNVDGTFLKTEDGQKNLQKFITGHTTQSGIKHMPLFHSKKGWSMKSILETTPQARTWTKEKRRLMLSLTKLATLLDRPLMILKRIWLTLKT